MFDHAQLLIVTTYTEERNVVPNRCIELYAVKPGVFS